MSATLAQFSGLPKQIRFRPTSVYVDPARVARYQDVVGLDLGDIPRAAVPPSFLYTIYLSQPDFLERYLEYGIDAQTAIHASQRFDYPNALAPGQTLMLASSVKKVIAKPGASNFIVSEETVARDEHDATAFVSTATFAFRASAELLDVEPQPPRPYTGTPDFHEILVPPVDARRLRAFADVSLDSNPIHLDLEAARAQGFQRPVVHGMLVMAFLGEACFAWVPGARFERFTIRFVASTPEGDRLRLVGRERGRDPQTGTVTLEVAALGMDGDVRATADVRLRV
mgnify:CR=1 FL=1